MARKPLSEEQKRKREERTFTRRVQTVFRNAGFTHLPTAAIERKFGTKTGELDNVFIYENVILVCEDTISAPNKVKDHLKNKKLLFDEIDKDRAGFLAWLRSDFAEQMAGLSNYADSRYQVFFLYFPKYDPTLDEDDISLFHPIRVVRPASLNYFHKMASNIRRSSRADIFRYLGLKSEDLGTADSGVDAKKIPATIIYPDDNTGLKNGVKLVSFMLSAKTLLDNSYVLRKDNWEDSIQLYQRLIEKERIQSIRRYLARKQTTFINNIIVSLPDGTEFEDETGARLDPATVQNFRAHRMLIPNELNSICVIDGQHRIFAHYEGQDSLEPEIAKLRSKLHLLVTGLIFPKTMSQLDRRTFESEIFLDINSEAKQVPPDVILFIETLKDPFSDLGVSRQVLDQLNRKGVFKGLFQMSLMEESRIKTASIIKFALRYLVAIHSDEARPTLFSYWEDDDKRTELLENRSEPLLKEYVSWCATTLNMYFSSVKQAFKKDWEDETSKLLSTTAINGFIIALRRSLPAYGVLDFDGYLTLIRSLDISFGRADFEYTSSQYAKFSRKILDEAMGLVGDGDAWVLKEP